MNSPVRPSSYPSDGKVCNCKKSNCLKLYCECFASGNCCVPNRCNCVSCLNNVSNENQRNLAIFATLERNPNAFRSKSTDDSQLPHKKGCHCKKSFCLKKYCECFQSRIVCTDKCRCQDCKNYDNSPDLLAASSVGTFLGPNRFVKSKFSDLFNADSLPAKVSVSPTNRSIDPVLAKFASKLSNEVIRQICDKLLAESEMVAPQSKRRRSSFDCLDNSEASESPADDFIDIFCRTLKSVVLPQNS